MARDRDERDDEDDDDRPRRRPARRDDDDEDGYEERRRGPQTSCPGSAKAAAIIWIILGGLGLLGTALSLANANTQVVVGLLVALAFLITGIQTLTGTVSSILGAGIASIILAVLQLGAAALVIAGGAMLGGVAAANANVPQAAPAGLIGTIIAAIGFVLLIYGALLLTAGILAIKGNGRYKAWRAYKKGATKRGGRRQEYDDDEEEDEPKPRKKRRDEDDD